MVESLTEEVMQVLGEATLFMEQFYGKFKNHKSDINFLVSMDENQKQRWLSVYYPKLVETNLIVDDRFFAPDGSQKVYGVGKDATFRLSEYCNIMYQLYKTIVNLSGCIWRADQEVLACILMLEPYVWYYAGQHTMTRAINLSGDHKKIWQEEFYPDLVEKKNIPDYSFFDENNKSMGIGTDGCFNGAELMHFLYQCYKYICSKNINI